MDFETIMPAVVLVIAGCVAAVTDVRNYKVHNWLTLPLFATGIVFHASLSGWSGLAFSLAGAFFGFVVLIACYILGGVGAGDVKLMSGVGAWLGLLDTSQVFLIAGVATGVWSMVVLSRRGGLSQISVYCAVMYYQMRSLAFHFGVGERVEEVVQQSDRGKRLVPLAAMIAIGIVTVVVAQNVFDVSLFGSAFERR